MSQIATKEIRALLSWVFYTTNKIESRTTFKGNEEEEHNCFHITWVYQNKIHN